MKHKRYKTETQIIIQCYSNSNSNSNCIIGLFTHDTYDTYPSCKYIF
jgi:hypothetical protein